MINYVLDIFHKLDIFRQNKHDSEIITGAAIRNRCRTDFRM